MCRRETVRRLRRADSPTSRECSASCFALSGATLGGNQKRVWCDRPVRSEPFSSESEPDSANAAIGQIVGEPASGTLRSPADANAAPGLRFAPRAADPASQRRRASPSALVHGACLLVAVLLSSTEAAAERISLLGFEGSSARALRWRVAGALKRAGHTVVGFAPPKDPSDTDKLRAFAERRRVDMFISGASTKGSDGWELALTLRNAEGDEVGRGVTLEAANLRAMMKELKEDGQSELDSAIRRGGGSSATGSSNVDAAPEADFAGAARSRAKKKKGARSPVEPVEEAIDLDDDSGSPAAEEDATASEAEDAPEERPARARRSSSDAEESDAAEQTSGNAEASGWATSDSTPAEDDGRESFLSGEGEGDAEVGVDDTDDSSSGDAAKTGDPTVVLGLNAGFVRRTLTYSDDLYARLRAPSANSWVYRLQAAIYPFAKPVKNRIGLIAGYESEFSGVVRDNAAGTDFGVTFSEVFGGVKLRQPLGKHEIAVHGTVGSMQAGLDDPQGQSGVPEFSYTSLRAALDVGLHFGSLAMRGSIGYRLPIGGYGEASEVAWFPRMEGYGTEGSLGLEYRISKEVAFDMSASMRRFLLQMNSQPEDALSGASAVAGGAVDLYLAGYFGLNITL